MLAGRKIIFLSQIVLTTDQACVKKPKSNFPQRLYQEDLKSASGFVIQQKSSESHCLIKNTSTVLSFAENKWKIWC